MKKRSDLAVLVTLAVGIAVPAVPLHAQFVYVANGGSSDVSAYSIGPTGTLMPIGLPVPTVGGPIAIAADPAGRFVYVANGGSILAYTIGPTGALTPIGLPVATGRPSSIAADPTGRFVYVGNLFSGTISVYSVGSTGALTPVQVAVPPQEGRADAVAVDPTGRFAFVASCCINEATTTYIIGPAGTLTAIQPAARGAGQNSIVVDPAGRFVYVMNGEVEILSEYRLGSTGVLTEVGRVGVFAENFVAIDPTGRFVYVASDLIPVGTDVGAILTFSIGPTGTLTDIGSPVSTGGRGFFSGAVDPTGRFVYAANINTGLVSAFSIGPTGALTPIGSPVPAGTFPDAVAVSGGRADLAANKLFNNLTDVSQFTLNGSAHQSGTVLRLTDDVMSQAGSAFLKTPILLRPDSSFSTSFAFRISGINGSGPQGSDGMAFVIQSDPRGATALGVGGGNLGLGTDGSAAAITPSIAIEFDTHANFSFENDDNHVALIVDGNVADHKAIASLPCPIQCLNSGSPVYVWVDYNGTTRRLSVFLANQAVRPATPLLSTTVSPLDQLSAHLTGRAFFGFTGATGAGFNIHDVLSWAITVPGMAGDINGDGAVGCSDLAALKTSLGKRSGQGGFNPLADMNGDGVVDVRDLAFVTQKIPAGTICP